MFLIVYVISVIGAAILMMYEYREGMKVHYPFTVEEKILAVLITLCPVANSLWCLWVINDYFQNK